MIRPVTVSEAEAAAEVYHLCAQHMNAHGFYNWNAGYPSYKEALADAAPVLCTAITDRESYAV